MNLEILQILTKWFARTEMVLRIEKRKLRVDKTYALERSLSSEIRQKTNEILEGELNFLIRGRFVDMGAGKKANKLESRDGNGRLLKVKARKPKVWYSKAWYGRINDLQGVLGYKMMESAIDSVKPPKTEFSNALIIGKRN